MMTRDEWDKLSDDEKWTYVSCTEKHEEGLMHLLHAFPPCPHHGKGCIPHAIQTFDLYWRSYQYVIAQFVGLVDTGEITAEQLESLMSNKT